MTRDVLPSDVLELLKAGNKIEAIKRLRGVTGLGLKEAKDWIESYERGEAAPLPQFQQPAGRDNRSDNVPREAIDALHSGNKIEAIKIVRESTGVGLAEAKSIVDEIESTNFSGLPSAGRVQTPSATLRARPGLAPGEVARTGGAVKWLALLAVAAIAVIAALYY